MSFAAPNRRLYVGRIPQDCSRLDLEDHFGSLGPKPSDVKVLNGYGFIEYDNLADAEDAKHELDNKDFMGDRLLVQFAKASERRPRYEDGPGGRGGDSYRGSSGRDFPPRDGGRGGTREQGWRLAISNLPAGCSWQDLKDFARTAGNVNYSEVSRSDPTEGIVEYMSHSDAEAAIKTLDGVDMRGSLVRVAEHSAPPGQTWSNPRASPPRRERDDDRRSYPKRDRSRSPGYRRGGGDRDDRDRRGGSSRYDDDDRRGDRGGDRSSSRRERSRERSPPTYSSRDKSRSPR